MVENIHTRYDSHCDPSLRFVFSVLNSQHEISGGKQGESEATGQTTAFLALLSTGDAGMELDGGNSGARTVLVGVKLDRRSRELLMWALVKVAEPGDLVIALHVLGTSTGFYLIFSLP